MGLMNKKELLNMFDSFIKRKSITWDKKEIINAFIDLVDEDELEEWLKNKEKVTEEELSKFLDEQDIEWIGDENDLYAWLESYAMYNYGIDEDVLRYFDFDKFREDLAMDGDISTVILNGTKYFVHIL